MDNNSIANIFSNTGPIAKAMPNYETRQEQIDMAEAVHNAIWNSDTLIVEAGTGVGKSFGYLVPIADYAIENDAIAVISTNTINLQEQLIHKDIPFLEKAIEKEFKAVLVKGKHNYLCMRRLRRSGFMQKDLFSNEYEIKQFAKILAWSYRTEDGSLYDFDEAPDPKVWDIVSANTETCIGSACPYKKQCFFQKAREKIQDARLLIVNHHLFFSNLSMQAGQKSILPEYDILVFDEAHSIENAATEHLAVTVSNSSLRYLMDMLFNPKKQKGFLLTIRGQGIDIMEWVQIVRKRADEFFKDIKTYLESHTEYGESGSLRVRKTNIIENTLCMPLTKLSEILADSKKHADNKEDEIEISSFIKKINHFRDSIDIIIRQTLENYVYWIESTQNKTSINAAPINIGDVLQNVLFASQKPIILTSATLSLSIDKDPFHYFKTRLGIKQAKELKLGSPFDYKTQVRMYISKNMPWPNNIPEYARASAEKIKRYLDITEGNAFVLFTSYSLMNSVYEELTPYFIEKGLNVLKQGNGIGRSRMLEEFKKETGSVLFGVDSFWQGIDVQGKALSNVIITKLPFAVPDSPIVQSRIEDIEKRGGDAFLEYNLPEAILRFKQGFGRLIRSKTDTGIIAILDSRIVKKSYGKAFINSVPECEVVIE